MTATPLHVLHVTETLATGVLDVVARMSQHQTALGHTVTVLHVPRTETPPGDALQERLGSAELMTVGEATQKRLTRLRTLRSALVELLDAKPVDVVHLHSSFAGLVGRLGRKRVPIIYSPHGFAFLRRDVSPIQSRAYQGVEVILARRSDALLCVSASEETVARRALRAHTKLLPNRLSLRDYQPRPPLLPDGKPLVVNVGRWSPQKAPERFVGAAQALHREAHFRWIGDGPDSSAPGVTVTGWLEPAEVTRELSEASLIYFTSRWEGMPVGLMQAQALGIPAVALRCVGVEDVVIDGVTGVIVDDEASAVEVMRDLLQDPARLAKLRSVAVTHRERFADTGYGDDLMSIYQEVINRHE